MIMGKTIYRQVGTGTGSVKSQSQLVYLGDNEYLDALTQFKYKMIDGKLQLTTLTDKTTLYITENPLIKDNATIIDKISAPFSSTLQYLEIGGCNTIPDDAFIPCSALKTVTLRNVGLLGKNAFKGCAALNIADLSYSKLKLIDESTFQNCSLLTDIRFPSQLETVETNAFNGCVKIVNVDFSLTKLKTLGVSSFNGCTSLTNVNLKNNSLETIQQSTFVGCSVLANVQIPTTLKTIQKQAFQNCSKLTTCDLGITSLISIEDNAFDGCTLLDMPSFPNTVINIGIQSFNKCSTLSCPIQLQSLGNLGNSCFNQCSTIPSVNLSGIIVNIPQYAFNECTSLNNITLGDSIWIIEQFAFYKTGDIVSINFNNIYDLGISSFAESNIQYFIGNNIKTIQDNAFYNCSKLSQNINLPICENIGLSAFQGSLISSISLNTSTTKTKIKNNAFKSCGLLTTVTQQVDIMDSTNVFQDCVKLNTIDIISTNNIIGDYSFQNCSQLQSIIFPSNITTIGKYAFAYSGLTTISFTNNNDLTTIDDYSFYKAQSLRFTDFPTNLVKIGISAFEITIDVLSSRRQIQIPIKLTTINNRAFVNSLFIINFPINNIIQTIGDFAFMNVKIYNTNLVFTQITHIGQNAFNADEILYQHPTKTLTIGKNNGATDINYCGLQGFLFEIVNMYGNITLSNRVFSGPQYAIINNWCQENNYLYICNVTFNIYGNIIRSSDYTKGTNSIECAFPDVSSTYTRTFNTDIRTYAAYEIAQAYNNTVNNADGVWKQYSNLLFYNKLMGSDAGRKIFIKSDSFDPGRQYLGQWPGSYNSWDLIWFSSDDFSNYRTQAKFIWNNTLNYWQNCEDAGNDDRYIFAHDNAGWRALFVGKQSDIGTDTYKTIIGLTPAGLLVPIFYTYSDYNQCYVLKGNRGGCPAFLDLNKDQERAVVCYIEVTD